MTGLAGCLLAYALLPTVPAVTAATRCSYPIYLYRVVATSGARRSLDLVGIDLVWRQFILSVAAGLLVPVMIHRAALRWRASRGVLLGM